MNINEGNRRSYINVDPGVLKAVAQKDKGSHVDLVQVREGLSSFLHNVRGELEGKERVVVKEHLLKHVDIFSLPMNSPDDKRRAEILFSNLSRVRGLFEIVGSGDNAQCLPQEILLIDAYLFTRRHMQTGSRGILDIARDAVSLLGEDPLSQKLAERVKRATKINAARRVPREEEEKMDPRLKEKLPLITMDTQQKLAQIGSDKLEERLDVLKEDVAQRRVRGSDIVDPQKWGLPVEVLPVVMFIWALQKRKLNNYDKRGSFSYAQAIEALTVCFDRIKFFEKLLSTTKGREIKLSLFDLLEVKKKTTLGTT